MGEATNIHVRGRKLGLIISPTIRIQDNSFGKKKDIIISASIFFRPQEKQLTNLPTNQLSHQRSFRRVISRVYLLCASEGLSLKKTKNKDKKRKSFINFIIATNLGTNRNETCFSISSFGPHAQKASTRNLLTPPSILQPSKSPIQTRNSVIQARNSLPLTFTIISNI